MESDGHTNNTPRTSNDSRESNTSYDYFVSNQTVFSHNETDQHAPVLKTKRFKLIFAAILVPAVIIGGVLAWSIFNKISTGTHQDTVSSNPQNESAQSQIQQKSPDNSNSTNRLEPVKYPATTKNQGYELLFFPSEDIAFCIDATSVCGEIIAKVADNRSVQLSISDLGLDQDALPINQDAQCESTMLTVQNQEQPVKICQAGFSDTNVLYYKFQFQLADAQIVGTFSGVNPSGMPFLDVSPYKEDLTKIIESIRPANP